LIEDVQPDVATSSRPAWRPTAFTWIGSSVLLLFLIVSGATGGFGGILITAGLVALVTTVYTVVTRRPSWLNLPRSRAIAAAGAAFALVVMIVGSSLYGSSHPTTPEAAPPTSITGAKSPSASPKTVLVGDVTGFDTTDAKGKLVTSGLRVTVVTSDGSPLPADTTGWTVKSQNPPSGAQADPAGVVVLTLAPPAPQVTPTPTASPVVAPAPAPPSAAPTPVAPAQPAPAPAQPAAQAPPAPAPAAPAPPQQAPVTGTVVPGGFCSPSDVGKSAVASNGRSYTCGGKGADASGHYHWNS
jgi:hypothetical protein